MSHKAAALFALLFLGSCAVEDSLELETSSSALSAGPCVSAVGSEASPAHLWSGALGSSFSLEVLDVATDSAGNSVITGSFRGGPLRLPGGITLQVNGSSTDAFLVKVSADGPVLWAKAFSSEFGNASDTGRAVAIAPNGDILLAGDFKDDIDLGGGKLQFQNGEEQVFVARFASNGTHLWSKAYGGGEPRDLALAPSGDIYLTGKGRGFAPGALLNGPAELNVFVLKLASTGAAQWAKSVGGRGLDHGGAPGNFNIGQAIAVDSAGSAVVTGVFEGTIDLGGPKTASGLDGLFAKFDTNGTLVWVRTHNATFAHRVSIDAADNILWGGKFMGTLDLGGATVTSATPSGSVFLVKYTSALGHVWSRAFGSGASLLSLDPMSLESDASGNVWLGGAFRGTVDLGSGAMASVGDPASGGDDFFVKVAGSNGSSMQVLRFGAGSAERGGRIAIAGTDAILAGIFKGTVDFGGGDVTSPGFTPQFGIGDSAIYVTRRGSGLRDVCAPVVSMPPDRTLFIDNPGQSVALTYTASATDNVGVMEGPTCNVASGTLVGVGSYQVTCSARDFAGNVGSRTWNVQVALAHISSNPHLYVSAENAAGGNRFGGPMVVEIIVDDPINHATNAVQPEPTVTVNGATVRMVQSDRGTWHAYLADTAQAGAADARFGFGARGFGLDFGTGCTAASATTISGVSFAATQGVYFPRELRFGQTSFGPPVTCNEAFDGGGRRYNHVTRENPENVNKNFGFIGGAATPPRGQIGLPYGAWPFIQLYDFTVGGSVVISYARAGSPVETVTLSYGSLDQFIDFAIDKNGYQQSDNVVVTLRDVQLNIDPTDEDSWTFATGATPGIYYQLFNEQGTADGDGTGGAVDLAPYLAQHMLGSNRLMTLDTTPGPQSHQIVILDDNEAQQITGASNATIKTLGSSVAAGRHPMTFLESSGNGGMFTNTDVNGDANLDILASALAGRALIEYSGTQRLIYIVGTDITPPALTVPSSFVVEASGPSGAAVEYASSAFDAHDGPVTPSCAPASGATFSLGVTTVSCTASDAGSNLATATFTVTVTDTTPPQLALPNTLVAEATGPSGAAVGFTASAVDLVDGAVTVACTPASGAVFALGTSVVSCSTSDARGNATSDSFVVTVVDTTAPVLTLPADVTAEATGPLGAVVSYPAATASDVVSGALVPVCAPASGSTFALGTTPVTCTVSDAAGNPASASFLVRVRDTVPPTITALSVSPSVLWPPNGKMIPVKVTASASDVVSATACAIASITSDEPDAGSSIITGALTAQLRAWRNGGGDGRTYTLHVSCSDAATNEAHGTVTVLVPHN